ncbi:DUF3379 domain-containing protein, partial [Vibrio sp. OPT46]|nr:DUF3379 domain-containing protein [Vibrio sp. OPT46]
FSKDGMTGIVQPVGSSSLILVGEEGENIDAIATTLASMIKPM